MACGCGAGGSSCHSAVTPFCSCSCGGACHGGRGAPYFSRQAVTLAQVVHKAQGRRSGKPSTMPSWRRRLGRIGVYYNGETWNYQERMLMDDNLIIQQIVEIINHFEQENPGRWVRPLPASLQAEIEQILSYGDPEANDDSK